MTKPDGNPDADRPSKSVEQNISIDRNEGQLHAVTSGDRSNVIQGDGSQITQIQRQTIHHHYVTHPSAEVKRERLPRFWSDRRWVLFFLGCAIVGVLGTVETVFHPLKAYKQRMAFQNCAKVAREENKPLVIIADFANSENSSKISQINPWLKQNIKDDPGGLNSLSDIQACSLDTVVSNIDEAKKIGINKHAELVIWGLIHELSLEIKIAPIYFELDDLNDIEVFAETKTQFEEHADNLPALLKIVIAHAIGDYWLDRNKRNEGIEILEYAINSSRSRLNLKIEISKNILRDAYYNLAMWLTPDDGTSCSKSIDECKRVINSYLQATRLDPNSYRDWVNLGEMYQRLNKNEDAKKIYDFILDSNPNSVHSAIACLNINNFPEEFDARDLHSKCKTESYTL